MPQIRCRDRHVTPRGWAAAAILAPAILGCRPAAEIRPDDVRSYSVARDAEPAAIMAADPPGEPAGQQPARRIRYDVPAGWTEGQAGGMRLATLFIGAPGDKREVTIIPASGTLESNVERWQGQLDPAAEPAVIAEKAAAAIAAAEEVDVAGVAAKVVLLRDSAAADDAGQAILAAVIPLDDAASLFVKFKGEAGLAARERETFKKFVSSVRWKE